MDIPDIALVIQWKATCSIVTMWQRFGRDGQDQTLEATAVLLAEKEHFDNYRTAKANKPNTFVSTEVRKRMRPSAAVPVMETQPEEPMSVPEMPEDANVETGHGVDGESGPIEERQVIYDNLAG
jgi:ERCC4-related helicase